MYFQTHENTVESAASQRSFWTGDAVFPQTFGYRMCSTCNPTFHSEIPRTMDQLAAERAAERAAHASA